MDMGWIVTYVSPVNPTAQISLVRGDISKFSGAGISIEVDDVNRLHGDAIARGYRITYPLTDEAFGVRRFAVEDPSGVVVNIMCHLKPATADR